MKWYEIPNADGGSISNFTIAMGGIETIIYMGGVWHCFSNSIDSDDHGKVIWSNYIQILFDGKFI